MRRCEVCGASYPERDFVCTTCNVALTDAPEPGIGEVASSFRSAYLGRFDEYEADLIVEILEASGIHAFTKVRRTDPTVSFYGRITADLGVVMVDASKIDEARRILAEEVPRQLEVIALEMEALALGDEEAWAAQETDDGGEDLGEDRAAGDRRED